MSAAGKTAGVSRAGLSETRPEKRQDGLKQGNEAVKRRGDTDTCLRAACGKPFVLKRSNQKHCSAECRRRHYMETHFVRI
jgi:hypothetical protein